MINHMLYFFMNKAMKAMKSALPENSGKALLFYSCDYPPRYAFLTDSSFIKSEAFPSSVMRPVSMT